MSNSSSECKKQTKKKPSNFTHNLENTSCFRQKYELSAGNGRGGAETEIVCSKLLKLQTVSTHKAVGISFRAQVTSEMSEAELEFYLICVHFKKSFLNADLYVVQVSLDLEVLNF